MAAVEWWESGEVGVRDLVKGGGGSSSDCWWWGLEDDGDEVCLSMDSVMEEIESRVLDGGVEIVVICIKRIQTNMITMMMTMMKDNGGDER